MKVRVLYLLQTFDPARHRVAFQFLIGGLGLLLLTSLLGLSLMLREALSAQTVNRVAIVVVFESGNTHQQCVEFTGDEISGLDVLQQTGLDLVVDASNQIGVAVCKIRRNGCDFPAENCFCKCQGEKCQYWSYWNADPRGDWTYAGKGTSNRMLHNGDIDGWVWGLGTQTGANPPPAINFDQVCGAITKPTITPSPTTPPTETLTATAAPATATPTNPLPTATRTTTVTYTPSVTRTPSLTGEATSTRFVPTRQVQSQSAPRATRPPEPTQEFIPTPYIEENQPLELQATSTPPPRVPTRVSILSSRSANATRAAEELEMAEQAQSQADEQANMRHLLSGIALVGGLLVGGAGLIVVLAGGAWYLLRRR